MNKYIDADKLIKLVNNYREGAKAALNPIDGDADYYKGKIDACENIQELIASLPQEQPSLPSNLDEAAEEYSRRLDYYHYTGDDPSIAFKAGAEWMAGQGYTREVEVKEDAGGYPYIPCIELYDYDKDEPLFKPVDKVVVQIRKK